VLINTGALTSASMWRIAISFILQILIARRLGVEGLGHYTIALAYLNVSQVIAELGLPTLLVRDLAQSPTHRRTYFRWLLGIQVATSFLTWAGLILLSFALPFAPVTAASLWLVGASLPLYAVTSAAETLFQAGERMELVMGVEVAINTLILLFSLGVLWRDGDELALIAVIIVTQAISAALCLFLLRRSRLLAAPQERALVRLGPLLRRTLPFFGLALSDVLLQRLDILLLGFIAGPAVTGIYSAAYNIVRVLMKLIQSFWRALYPTLSRLQRHAAERYLRLRVLSLRFGLLAVLPAAAISFGVAPELLRLMFGGDYGASAEVYRILIWAAPLFLVEVYALTLLMIEHQLRASLWVSALHIAGIVILVPVLTPRLGADGAALAVVAAGAAGTLASLWLLHVHKLAVTVKRLWGILLATGAAGAVSTLTPVHWLASMTLASILYLLICWATAALSVNDLQTLRRLIRPENAPTAAETPG
jgi:PST family polysaccharide transporter